MNIASCELFMNTNYLNINHKQASNDNELFK